MDRPVFVELDRAPLPDTRTLSRRRNVFVQLTRFARFNVRMLSIIGKGEK